MGLVARTLRGQAQFFAQDGGLGSIAQTQVLKMALTWTFTVSLESPRSRAICLLARPWDISDRISSWRGVSMALTAA